MVAEVLNPALPDDDFDAAAPIAKMIIDPVNTPIWLDRNSPTCGTRKMPRAMPCRLSATIRINQTVMVMMAMRSRAWWTAGSILLLSIPHPPCWNLTHDALFGFVRQPPPWFSAPVRDIYSEDFR